MSELPQLPKSKPDDVAPCRCEAPNPECQRAHAPMEYALWKCCHGEGSITKDQARKYRQSWDNRPPPPKPKHRPAAAHHVDDHEHDEGPGLELEFLLAQLGVPPRDCDCASHAHQMNHWGVAGCRAHRAEIVGWLKSEQVKRGWALTAKAAALSVLTGTALALDPRDLIGSLVDLAIARAEAKTKQMAVQQPKNDTGAS
jgi:hypothetical protein